METRKFISDETLRNADAIQQSFQSAQPFRHICIDNFFEPEAAEKLLEDFPDFDRRRAINEFGDVGGKAVNTKLADISPFYKLLYEHLLSQDFLSQMSALTGILDLVADPTMFGGGTHDNQHGQSLDPHVDFNYTEDGLAHRRMNLLLYLNKSWDQAWGGSIELHSDPRDLDNNQIKSFNVSFNRCVIFETNEVSWHGFPQINLPEHLRHRSRKCLSVYLYTKERPVGEAVGRHGTFYVQRPLEPRFKAGYLLQDGDVKYLRSSFGLRDRMIEQYQKNEEKSGRQQQTAEKCIAGLMAGVPLPLIGYVRQRKRLAGVVWPDGWVSKEWQFEMKAVRDLRSMRLAGFIPEYMFNQAYHFNLYLDGTRADFRVDNAGSFELASRTNIEAGRMFSFGLKCDTEFNPKEKKFSDDDRNLSYNISEVEFC